MGSNTELLQTVLREREKTHGAFSKHAKTSVRLKTVLWTTMRNVSNTTPEICPTGVTHIQWESLDMICHKLGRIAAGDPFHRDHWFDIAGYALLVVDELDAMAASTAEKAKGGDAA